MSQEEWDISTEEEPRAFLILVILQHAAQELQRGNISFGWNGPPPPLVKILYYRMILIKLYIEKYQPVLTPPYHSGRKDPQHLAQWPWDVLMIKLLNRIFKNLVEDVGKERLCTYTPGCVIIQTYFFLKITKYGKKNREDMGFHLLHFMT